MSKKTATISEKEEVKKVFAIARNIHISPRKVRLVADLIRGKSVSQAVTILQNLRKRASISVLKVLLSSVANAENNNKMDKEKLFLFSITVDSGTRMKRYFPRAYGRASMIKRPTSHITVALIEKESKKAKTSGFKFPLIPKRAKKVKALKPDEKVKNVADEIISSKRIEKVNTEQEKSSKKGFLSRIKKTEVNRKGGEK